MTAPGNPMVPSVDWGRRADEFASGQGRQALLCASCVIHLGLTTPPQLVVVFGGQSWCLDHFPRNADVPLRGAPQ